MSYSCFNKKKHFIAINAQILRISFLLQQYNIDVFVNSLTAWTSTTTANYRLCLCSCQVLTRLCHIE